MFVPREQRTSQNRLVLPDPPKERIALDEKYRPQYLADMLGQVAEYYEADVEGRTKDLSTIIEPFLMLFIGVFVGIFALSMISPIYSLSDKI